MTTRLLRNATIHGATATALALEDGRIAFVGPDDGAAPYEGADEVLDLGGRLVTPAFVDAHVHVIETGDLLTGLDLTGTTSRAEALDRTAEYARRQPDGAIIGQGWDDTLWPEVGAPTADQLERIAPGRLILLCRIDGHSAVVSPALAAEVPGLPHFDGAGQDGWVERDALRAVNDRAVHLIPPGRAEMSARAALREMARLGIGAFHLTTAPHIGPEEDLDVVRAAAAEVGLHGTYYWGEHLAFGAVDRLGVTGLAGDLNVDGAFGSRTAALRERYADAEGRGHVFLDVEQITDHVVGCTERGIQAGFHCIGDSALDAVAEGFARAVEKLGEDAIRGCRHRLEHCEMPGPEAIALFANLGMVASVQPMFDGLWGGPDRMYAQRLGERWRRANPFRHLADAGVRLAFGSDSPVTTLDPWRALRAAVRHRTPGQQLTPEAAFEAHTAGGWYAARIDGAGRLAVGQRATYAVWDTPEFPDLTAEDVPPPACTRTVVDGRTVFLEGET